MGLARFSGFQKGVSLLNGMLHAGPGCVAAHGLSCGRCRAALLLPVKCRCRCPVPGSFAVVLVSFHSPRSWCHGSWLYACACEQAVTCFHVGCVRCNFDAFAIA